MIDSHAIVESVQFIAGEDALLEAEQKAEKRAIFDAARKARTVGKTLRLVRLLDEFSDDFDDFNGRYNGYAASYEAAAVSNDDHIGGSSISKRNLDVELVRVRCTRQVDAGIFTPLFDALSSVPFASDLTVQSSAASASGYGANDFTSIARAIKEEVDVLCILTVRVDQDDEKDRRK